jgi:superoxide reductase
VVNVSGNKVEVTVGQITHPMLPEHHIMYVDFYINDKGITRVALEVKSEPKASVELNLQKGQELKVLENCNLHGRWVSAVKI